MHEFAELSGVTVRTLHHYDRIGLLRAQRNERGFRVYTSEDLPRLQNIIALKFIGLALKQIRTVLDGGQQDLGRALRTQISALEEKQRRIQIAIDTICRAEAALRTGETPCLTHIIEVLEMQNDNGWILEHFNAEARPRVETRLADMTPASWSDLETRWDALAAEIYAQTRADPGARESQALLSRWEDLIRQTTGGDQDLVHGLKSLYAGRGTWPEQVRNALTPILDDSIMHFIQRAVAARAR